ncbi:MAG: DEAD/DEAH box helicase, partial [Acidimicrobiales bacterium]
MGFDLDRFQLAALDALDAGHSVVVAAPTGSGKTVVATYAAATALAAGHKAFYTTPLKALSNQKYAELASRFGPSAVGLLTGDSSVNPGAAVVVMTTEVLRNMIYASSGLLDGLGYVVLDEVHYLQDAYRGAVWEEVVIHLPAAVDLVCLSATVSNAAELADWIGTVRGTTEAIVEDRRPVQLHDLYMVGRRGTRPALLPVMVNGRPNPEGVGDLGRGGGGHPRGRRDGRLYRPRRGEVVEVLDGAGMLPAIYFLFSRDACEDAARRCRWEGRRLTDAAERHRIRAVVGAKVGVLAPADLAVLGYQDWLGGLEAGYAAHHAGMVPPFKEAVEACFEAGLVKVVFATETLSLGINMPARSVVIENLTKWSGERHQLLTPGEYTQLTGRAGRRGIDEVGHAVVLWSPWVGFDQVAALVGGGSGALASSFRPTYNMAANLVRRYSPETAGHLLNLSFAQYRTERAAVVLAARLERTRSALEEAEAGAARPGPDGAGRSAAAQAARLAGEAESLVRRIDAAGESLALQFDRVLGLLGDWGYVAGWALSAAGESLAGLYHECDLVVVECAERGVLDGLGATDLAGLVSVFTFQPRAGQPRAGQPRAGQPRA